MAYKVKTQGLRCSIKWYIPSDAQTDNIICTIYITVVTQNSYLFYWMVG